MTNILYLGIIILAAVGTAKILRKLKFPNVTGYLIAGVLIGHNVLNIVPKSAVDDLSIISEVALGFIAFSIGSSFRIPDLKKQGASTIVITLMESLVAMLFVFVVLVAFFHTSVPFALMLSSIACATAPAATLMVIRQYNARGPLVDTLLPVVALDDAVSIMAFGISASISQTLLTASNLNVQTMVLEPLREIFLALIIGAALGFLLCFLLRKSKSQGNVLNLEIAIIFVGIAVASLLKVSSLLLCMAIGAVIANLAPNPRNAFSILDPFTTPIFLAFFTISGAALDMGALASVGWIGIAYLVIRALGKWVGAFVSCTIYKKPQSVIKNIGLALMPQAGVALGLSLTAANILGAHGEQVRTVILATTVVYELIGPMAAKFALKRAGEI